MLVSSFVPLVRAGGTHGSPTGLAGASAYRRGLGFLGHRPSGGVLNDSALSPHAWLFVTVATAASAVSRPPIAAAVRRTSANQREGGRRAARAGGQQPQP